MLMRMVVRRNGVMNARCMFTWDGGDDASSTARPDCAYDEI
jgi:hypothetical protein